MNHELHETFTSLMHHFRALKAEIDLVHHPGKRNTQRIEWKHLTLRMRIKRLARKTICFSKSIQMHDIIIGLFVNRYEFAGRDRTYPRRRRPDSLVGQLTLGCRSCSSFRKVAETEYDPSAVLPSWLKDVKLRMGDPRPIAPCVGFDLTPQGFNAWRRLSQAPRFTVAEHSVGVDQDDSRRACFIVDGPTKPDEVIVDPEDDDEAFVRRVLLQLLRDFTTVWPAMKVLGKLLWGHAAPFVYRLGTCPGCKWG
jgi:IS1 transposase